MSEIMDEELLGGEELDDDTDFTITREREEALLEDEDDYPSRKKDENYDEELDVLDLDLDIDEDFEEDKILYEEDEREQKKEKFVAEKPVPQVQNVLPMTTPHVKAMKRPVPVEKSNNAVPQLNDKVKKRPLRNDNWKRGNGRNFQNRHNFVKNNVQRRRNGTVLINPRYEGTVHINDNNARLAWDSPQHPPSNAFVQPWSSGNNLGNCNPNLLMSNIMNGIANTLANTPSNMLLQPASQPQNKGFYEPPPKTYEQPLSFEPPPHIIENRQLQKPYKKPVSGWDYPYSHFEQVSSHQMLSSGNSHPRNNHYNNQMAKMQGPPPVYNSYSNYTGYSANNDYNLAPKKALIQTSACYDNKNFEYNKYNSGPTTYSDNYSQSNDFQIRNDSYYRNNEYQNKNINYNTNYYEMKEKNYNYTSPSYEKNNFTGNNVRQGNQNVSYQPDFKTNQPLNQQNTKQRFRKDFNKPVSFGNQRINDFSRPNNVMVQKETFAKRENSGRQNVQFTGFGTKDINTELSEIQFKVKEEEKIKTTEIKPQVHVEQRLEVEEDEETRLYRLKIEEQKREREKVLKAKEERRKQMLAQRKEQEEKCLPQVGLPNHFSKQNAPNFVRNNNFGTDNSCQGARQGFAPPSVQTPKQCSTSNPNLILTTQTKSTQDISDDLNLTFKVSNNLPTVKNPKPETSGFMSNRVVVVKSINAKSGMLANSDVKSKSVIETSSESDMGQGLSSFFNNRKVLKKDNSLLNTRLLVVNNLSTTVTHDKLMALSRGIGEIEKLRVDKQERQATILFKSVASAHAFFKKYQRRILDDLSVIEVKLEPML